MNNLQAVLLFIGIVSVCIITTAFTMTLNPALGMLSAMACGFSMGASAAVAANL